MGTISVTSKLESTIDGTTVSNAVYLFTTGTEAGLSHLLSTTQAVGTSPENIALGDIDLRKQHFVRLRNKDATNNVIIEVYSSAGVKADAFPILPGESWGPARLEAQTDGYPKLMLKSSTSTVIVELTASEAGTPP